MSSNPATTSKKRSSICLEAVPSFGLDSFAINLKGPELLHGNFRKSRRFSDNEVPGIPGGEVIPQETYVKNERRSSMALPRTMWKESEGNECWRVQRSFYPIPLHPKPALSVENFLPFDIPSLENNRVREEEKPSCYQYYYLDDLSHIGLTNREDKTRVKNVNRKGAWKKEEDDLLKKYAGNETNKNKNWTEIAEKIPGRTAKQCRERWCFNLDPSINKEDWRVDEDLLLIKRQAALGNKWAQIAQLLPGRTENAVKTRFKSILRARKREWKPHEDLHLLELQQKIGANWELIASSLDTHRTKHAVKIRFKELQQGLDKVKEPENGSARQTVRKMLYPKENLIEISKYYQQLADGLIEFQKPVNKLSPMKTQSTNLQIYPFAEMPIDELLGSWFVEEEPLMLV